ncbi:MAG: type II secretion system F family protein [Methylococcales bacterium]
MTYFHYKGRRDNGLSVKGWILAENRDDALTQLAIRGIQPYTVQSGPGNIALTVPIRELLASLHELASLRNSGMPLERAISMIAESLETGHTQASWKELCSMVRSGMSLSDAMLSLPDTFPRFVAHLVKIGEANGQLGSALSSAADRLDEELKLRTEVRTALTYPAFLIVISFVVVLFLFLTVIPNFATMVGDMGGHPSVSLQVLIAISFWLREYFWFWSLAVVGLGFVLRMLQKSGKISFWRVIQKISGIRQLVSAWEIVQFCSSMQRLLKQGVKLLEAVHLSADALGRDEVRDGLKLVCKSVQQGGTLGAALREQNLFTPLAQRMIETGEAAANLPDSMTEIARLYQRTLQEGMRRILALLEPMVIAGMGLIVGGIMVSLMSAIMSLNDLPI